MWGELAVAQPEESWPVGDSVMPASISTYTGAQIFEPAAFQSSSGHFGCDVAQSGDVVLVRKGSCSSGSTYTGSIYWYRRVGGVWQHESPIEIIQGNAMAVDGNLAVIGQPDAAPNNLYQEGQVLVYRWDGSQWVKENLNLPPEHRQAEAYLGYSVAIVGNTVLAGAPLYDFTDPTATVRLAAGRVYVWTRQPDGVWVFQAVIENPIPLYSDKSNSWFGYDIRVSGTTALVGHSTYYQNGVSKRGHYEVYDLINSIWTLSANPIIWDTIGISDLAFS